MFLLCSLKSLGLYEYCRSMVVLDEALSREDMVGDIDLTAPRMAL